MGRNKRAREQLEKLYGKECFIEKLHLRKDEKPRKYKGKKQLAKMRQLTFHHIVKREHGGESTAENGALLSRENHTWFHKQSQEDQERMNEEFQKYKLMFAIVTTVGVSKADEFDLRITDYKSVPLQKNKQTHKQIRAKQKQIIRKELENLDEYYEELNDDYEEEL